MFTEFSKRLMNVVTDPDGCQLDSARLAKEESPKAPDIRESKPSASHLERQDARVSLHLPKHPKLKKVLKSWEREG